MATEPDDELLAAYLDGVAELSPDERHRIERRLEDDPALRADADATRSLIERVRALPPIGVEPDFAALERQIRTAVGPTVPAPWWRRMRWLAPVSALATTAAIALLWLHHAPIEHVATPTQTRDAGASPFQMIMPAAVAIAPAPTPEPTPTTTMWIDGQVIDIGNVDPEVLLDDQSDGDTDQAEGTGLLPAADLGWVDDLDDKAIERAERWLARKKG